MIWAAGYSSAYLRSIKLIHAVEASTLLAPPARESGVHFEWNGTERNGMDVSPAEKDSLKLPHLSHLPPRTLGPHHSSENEFSTTDREEWSHQLAEGRCSTSP